MHHPGFTKTQMPFHSAHYSVYLSLVSKSLDAYCETKGTMREHIHINMQMSWPRSELVVPPAQLLCLEQGCRRQMNIWHNVAERVNRSLVMDNPGPPSDSCFLAFLTPKTQCVSFPRNSRSISLVQGLTVVNRQRLVFSLFKCETGL